jgi:4-hydroxy-tetrahydrodipicolinate reductase
MNKINLMINGVPGNVAITIARHVIDDNRFNLLPYSLTGPDINETIFTINNFKLTLIQPDKREQQIKLVKEQYQDIYVIDFTHPSSVNSNALFYINNKLPFAMGTTGGDREKLEQDINKGGIPAVIAPNMAKQIVGFQAMMEYGANTFPDLFKGFSLEIMESHQNGKADTSGTAKAMVKYFNKMGLEFSNKDIKKERNPEIQKTIWEIPEEYLSGHGFHTYTIKSKDGTCEFQFKHNICGRDIYVDGSLDAILFLNRICSEKNAHDINFYTMIDVLKKKI